MTGERLLDVEDLSVTFRTPKGPVEAVRGVSFTLGREKLGIVGESGSGKSQTGRSILGLTAGNGWVSAKRFQFDGIDLLSADRKTLRAIRGNRISMILQDPKYSLNPVMPVGRQIAEAFLVHHQASKSDAKRRALEMLAAVRIPDPERVYGAYPQELSGGMGQRGMIAMMMIPEPDIVIADEPTSALDVTVSLQVLAILDKMVTRRNTSLILISHDLDLVASFCDRVLVMYAGRIVESCLASELSHAQHPYTRGLLSCLPQIEEPRAELATLVRDASWAE
ncbi:MAG: ABC transporter ATP-binding protein [Geminicoccaceae bacterium]